MKFGSRIPNLNLAKVALLIMALVLLPRFIGLLETDNAISGYFSGSTLGALLLRAVFFFGFTFLGLQLNTNFRFDLPFTEKWKTLFFLIALNLIWAVAAAFLFTEMYQGLGFSSETNNDLRFVYTIFIVLGIVVFMVSDSINLQRFRQEAKLENEQLKQQNLKTELNALRNQVNPHFLFNSLNSLLSLVRANKQASQYVKELSFLFRYTLQSGTQDLVSLQEELRFLNSYIHLIQTRYRDRFSCAISIEDRYLNYKIPPMALQLLVENAVKHNEISEEYPLLVSIVGTPESITVSNVIKPRTNFSESSHVGLANLNSRYQLLLGKNIVITSDNNEFKVELPLIS